MLRAALATVVAVFMAASVLADDVTASVSEPVFAGEAAQLTISVDGDESPKIERLPKVDGLTWGRGVSTSSRTEIVNMRRHSVCESVITFSVDREGSFTIPPVQVRVGKLKLATSPQTFEVKARKFDAGGEGAAAGIDELSFVKLAIPLSAGKAYVGEDMPLEIKLYRLASAKGDLSWPDLDFGSGADVVFKDYRDSNPENPKFDRYRQGRESVGGRLYEVVVFNTMFRALAPGKLAPKVSVRTTVIVEDRNSRRASSPFDDDFFFGSPFSRGRSVERVLTASAPAIEILPLPPPQKGQDFLGLVGKWTVEPSIADGHARVGEPLTLRLKIRGSGSLETLKAPQLELPGFRVYPPEIDRGKGEAEIRYVLIPTAEGEADVSVGVSTFDSASGRYKGADFSKRVKVERSLTLSGAAAPSGQVVLGSKSAEADSGRAETSDAPRKRPSGVLYLKRRIDGAVSLPLWRNAVAPASILLFAGFAGMLAMLFIQARRAAHAADPKLARRKAAYARRKDLLRQLKELPPEKLSGAASERLLPYIGDLLDAPPGASASDLAERLKTSSPELSECLSKIGEAAWAPGLGKGFDESFKRRLIDAVSKLSLIVCVGFLTFATAFGAESKPLALSKGAGTVEEAMTAYDTGDFAGAAAFFKSKLDPACPSPAALYDLGNCLCQSGDLPKALLCYERALRLAPRDSDILENLNLVRRKLDLPELYRVESPADAIPCVRDFLRPDEWLCVLAAGLALVMLSIGLRKLRGDLRIWVWLLGAGLGLALLSGVCAVAQSFSSYSPDQAIALIRNASVRTLPSESSAVSDMNLRPGQDLRVLEKRGDWMRVRSGESEGWLKAGDAALLWRPDPASSE